MTEKKKTIIKAGLLYLAVFAAGTFTALSAAGYIIDKSMKKASEINNFMITKNAEQTLWNAVTVLKFLKEEQLENVYEMSCITVSLFLDFKAPELYHTHPIQKQELKELQEEGRTLLKEMLDSGKCNSENYDQ